MRIINELRFAAHRLHPKRFTLIAASAAFALAAIIGVSDFASKPLAKTVSVTIPATQTAGGYSCTPKTYTVVGMRGGKIYRLDITAHSLCHPKTASTTTISPLARAESSLTSEWVHFCFTSSATETTGTNGPSTQQSGCGSQNYAAKVATVSVTSSVSIAGQSQSQKSVAETRIGKSEWVDVGGKWQKSTAPFPAASPGAIASLMRATPGVKKVAGIKVLGQATTGYQGVFTAADLASHKKALTPSMATALAGSGGSGKMLARSDLISDTWTAYINNRGQVIRFAETVLTTSTVKTEATGTNGKTIYTSGKVAITGKSTVLYSRYGQPATITAPGPGYAGPPAPTYKTITRNGQTAEIKNWTPAS